MPRRPRKLLGEILCHHMVQGINQIYIFEGARDKEKYLSLLKKYNKQFHIDIIAYCIMDNHAHFLFYSEKIENISRFMQQVNSQYAIYYNKKNTRVGYVYRNRFKSVPIMSRDQMYTCIKYIHMNPVKAKIVKNEGEYKYSSYNNYLNQNGFLNERILSFIFNSSHNYIDKFKSIEYKNLNFEKEQINIEDVLNHFLSKEGISFQEIRENKIFIQKFIAYLISNQYQFSKKELAETLKISRATFYRRLYK